MGKCSPGFQMPKHNLSPNGAKDNPQSRERKRPVILSAAEFIPKGGIDKL